MTSSVRLDAPHADGLRRDSQVISFDRRLHLFTHSQVETSRRTFAGIGQQDLSALKASTDGQGGGGSVALEIPEEDVLVRLPNGKMLAMPRLLGPDERRELDAFLASLTPEQASHVQEQARAYGTHMCEALVESAGRPELVMSKAGFESANRVYDAVASGDQASNDDLRTSMYSSLYGIEMNLYSYFQQVQEEQQVAALVRTDIAELEGMLADWPEGQVETFSYREVIVGEDGSIRVVEHIDVELNRAEAEALLFKMQANAASLGEFNMMDMQRLQLMVNEYQRAVNTTSNIMKHIHETGKAILGNARV